MFDTEKRILMQQDLKDGLKKTAIAKMLGISRQTVYRWITNSAHTEPTDHLTVYRARPKHPSKLNSCKVIIAEDPLLSAVSVFQEVQVAGYEGGYGLVKLYLRQVRSRTQNSFWRMRSGLNGTLRAAYL